MDFAILGPLEVHADRGEIRVAGARLRALLSLLLINRNEVLASDRILDELWPDRLPTSGRAALQTRIAALRRAIGPDRITTREPGYVLRVEADELDADRFERLIAHGRDRSRAGDPAGASSSLADALRLWRGDPLIDVSSAPFAQAEIRRLSELRLTAIEDQAEARLASADPGDVVKDLQGLVDRHPFSERLRGVLITALYRAGRQADALEAYQVGRRTLADELGIDPGPALQALQQAVLAQDPDLLGAKVAAAGAQAEHRRTITVMLVDPGATGDTDPELARASRESLATTTRQVVGRHGGRVFGFVGDRLLAAFGVPTVHEDDATRAVRAARALTRADGPRIAIATGEVVAGGEDQWDRAGRPVNEATRLLDAAAAGQVLVDRPSRALVRASARLRPIDAPDAWLVEAIDDMASDTVDTPFVGRGHELGQLRQTLERARDQGSAQLLTVIAPPGLGKSRLARQFAWAVQHEALVLEGHCPAYGEGITFWPIAEMLERLIVERPLPQVLAGQPDAETIRARLTTIIGSGDADVGVQEVFWAVRRLVEALGRERPVVLLVEDIHWAEPTLLTLLDYLASWTQETAVVLLCLARPELLDKAPSWGGGKVNAATIVLEPLGGADSATLVGSLAVADRLTTAARERIQAAAEGNPLFIEQIGAYVAEHALTDRDIPIPPTIQALLAARIEQLPPPERSLLEHASIVGREFTVDALVALLPPVPSSDRSAELRALESREFVRVIPSRTGSAAAYRFRHVLLQQSAYLGMTRALRAELHERYADWLVSSGADPALDTDELVGYHLEQAVLHRRAIGATAEQTASLAERAGTRLLAAGERAFDAGDMGAGAGLLRRATDLLPMHDPGRLASLPDLSVALFETGRLEEAATVLDEAMTIARDMGDRQTLGRATVQAGQVRLYVSSDAADVDASLKEVGAVARRLARLGDRLGAARAWRTLSELHLMQGSVRAAERDCRRAIDHAEAASSRRERAWLVGQTGFCWLWGPARVTTMLRDLRALLRSAAGDPLAEANILGFLAVAEMMARERDSARADMDRGRAMTRALGLTWQVGFHDTLAADLERIAGEPGRAEPLFRSAMTVFLDQGDRWTASCASLDLADVLIDLDRIDEALERMEAADTMPMDADSEWRIKRAATHGRALARIGRGNEALALAEEAVTAALRTDYVELQGTVMLALAEVQAAIGRGVEARASVNAALDTFVRKGDRTSAARARQALEHLSTPRA